MLRVNPLLLLNWMVAQHVIDLTSDSAFLLPMILTWEKVDQFQRLVERHSMPVNMSGLRVDWLGAVDVRTGVSQTLGQMLMFQVTRQYSDPADFRHPGAQPWRVLLVGESGADAGGLAQELVAEYAIDLCCPACGLVVPVPNARNDIGDMKDLVIPYPNPRHTGAGQQYEFAGALIAIAIRSELVQEFSFPPLVWDYLVTGRLTIDRIFEVDQNYMLLIQSLQEALRRGVDEAEFTERFQLKFVISDSAGQECPLTQRGRLTPVTLANCGSFISLANEFRLNELRPSLDAMRKGFWDNLGFEPVKNLDWRVIEFSACDKDVHTEALKAVTCFRLVDQPDSRVAEFWKVVEQLTPNERIALLKFATVRTRLPPRVAPGQIYLFIDDDRTVDKLPSASTCFQTLHLPVYTSYSKALQSIRVAIPFTGTFERA
jgi:hypothetical protein